MTTDTCPKHLALEVTLSSGKVTIGGIAKGAGMIHPDMATLLGVLTTDALIAPANLPLLLQTAVDRSFNAISVDGDTSTNDTILLLANGASGNAVAGAADLALFGEALNALCRELALMVVADGEGATRVVTLQISGAPDDAGAKQVATAIATSLLVKTAFAGGDANWGRILAAAGRAGVPFDPAKAQLSIGTVGPDELQLLCDGTPTSYLEADAAAVFARSTFQIHLDLGAGHGAATMWTSDLTQEYVHINADYRS
jgi:glutamate N-acetyltransferase/amino-acid N-acetyltransferase